MDADWEVEIGGGAPVIEALWTGPDDSAGFIDLRESPERVSLIEEAVRFSPLADLLLSLNGAQSPVWTSKCDVWEPEAGSMALYIDMLPRAGLVFSEWQQAETFCRELVERLKAVERSDAECSVELVIRQAIAGEREGFGITAYLSAQSREGLALAMADFAAALVGWEAAAKAERKLQ